MHAGAVRYALQLYACCVQSAPAISIFVLTVPGSRQLTVGSLPDSRSACSAVSIIIASLLSEYALCWLNPFSCRPLRPLSLTGPHQASAGCNSSFTALKQICIALCRFEQCLLADRSGAKQTAAV